MFNGARSGKKNRSKFVHYFQKILLTIIFSVMSFAVQGCFSDKGGGSQNSILNLSPQQQLHGVVETLENEKIIYDETKMSNNISVLDRITTGSSGQTKYDIIFFNALYKIFYIDILLKKGNFKARQLFDMLYASESDLRYFVKANYRMDDYHLVLGLFNSIRNYVKSAEDEKRQFYKRAKKHYEKLFRPGFFFTSDYKVGGVFITQNDVRLYQVENEVRYENPFEAFETLKKLDSESEEFTLSPQYRTKKAQLLVIAGRPEDAAKLLVDFKGKKFMRSPYYDEGLWTLKGVYEMMVESDENRSIDVKVVNGLMKENGGFYAKGGVLKLQDYLPKFNEVQKALWEASYLYYSGKYHDAAAVAYDILDYAEDKSFRFKKQDASPDDQMKAHKILWKSMEKMKKSDSKTLAGEKTLAADPFETEEVEIDLDVLIEMEKRRRGEIEDTEEVAAATGEVKLHTGEVSAGKFPKIVSAEKKADKKTEPEAETTISTEEISVTAYSPEGISQTAETSVKNPVAPAGSTAPVSVEKMKPPKPSPATDEVSGRSGSLGERIEKLKRSQKARPATEEEIVPDDEVSE